jgi:hypothetical protein
MFATHAALTFTYLMLAVLWCSASLLTPSPAHSGSAAEK